MDRTLDDRSPKPAVVRAVSGDHVKDQEARVIPLRPRLLDLKDASLYCGISETRLREFIKYGKLQSVSLPHPFKKAKDTRKILIAVSELDAFIDRYTEVCPNSSTVSLTK